MSLLASKAVLLILLLALVVGAAIGVAFAGGLGARARAELVVDRDVKEIGCFMGVLSAIVLAFWEMCCQRFTALPSSLRLRFEKKKKKKKRMAGLNVCGG